MRAVCFDMDGTIADTEGINFKADFKVIKDAGANISEGEYLQLTGKPAKQIYQQIIDEQKLDANLNDMLLQREVEIENNLKDGLAREEGLNELMILIRAHGMKIALTTSSTRRKTKNILKALNLEYDFDIIVTGSDVKNNKPAPDVYKLAAEKLKLKPSECIAVEDSVTGILSAKSAGMKCIGIKHIKTKTQDLSKADILVNNLKEITLDMLKD